MRPSHYRRRLRWDGNGGQGGRAADLAIAELRCIAHEGFADWSAALLAVDQLIRRDGEGGETTCVVAEITDDGQIRGASCVDSSAWMLARSGVKDLTAQQDRARMGSGKVNPIRFQAQLMGQLVLATDGLFKYIRAADLRACAARGVVALFDRVRLESGALQDDVAVILVE